MNTETIKLLAQTLADWNGVKVCEVTHKPDRNWTEVMFQNRHVPMYIGVCIHDGEKFNIAQRDMLAVIEKIK